MTDPTWDILINSLQHRSGKLRELLGVLEPQMVPGVAIKALVSPTPESSFIDCTNRLIETSEADYVCFIDDDDLVAPHYVEDITGALRRWPDYVGFRVRYTENGVLQVPVVHSLSQHGWENNPELITRDITHFNPIRRELIPLWPSHVPVVVADRTWATEVRESGKVQSEVFVDDELHYYRHCTTDTAADRSTLVRSGGEDISGEFPWVEWL